ncbi:MAG: hypothetical protein LBP24_04075 [Coriobacteriales bacterium]|jgi:hypothetical protein|nr:hypothetical protein [Coriobacteriales bacterium]
MGAHPEIEAAERNFDDLLSNDATVRLKAAEYFSWLARDEGSDCRGEIFEREGTYEKLYPLLKDENKKIACAIIAALGCGYLRYNQDPRVVDELVALYDSTDKDILYMAVRWTAYMDTAKEYAKLSALLEKAKSQKLIEAICEHFNDSPDDKANNLIQEALLKKLGEVKNAYSIKTIVGTILNTINDKNMINLKTFVQKQPEEMRIRIIETVKDCKSSKRTAGEISGIVRELVALQ